MAYLLNFYKNIVLCTLHQDAFAGTDMMKGAISAFKGKNL